MNNRMYIPFLVYICENNKRKVIMENDKFPYINTLGFQNYRNFKGKHQIYFSQMKDDAVPIHGEIRLTDEKKAFDSFKLNQWTVFLGNNGTGKTNLLKLIANFNIELFYENEKGEKSFTPLIYKNFETKKEKEGFTATVGFCLNKDISISSIHSSDFVLALQKDFEPDDLKKNTWFGIQPLVLQYGSGFSLRGIDKYATFGLYAYGVHRHVSKKTSLSESESNYHVNSLYDDTAPMVDINDWLVQLEFAKRGGDCKAESILIKLQEIFKETLFPDLKSFSFQSDEKFNIAVYFETENGSFRFSELGWGYQASLAWIFDLCKRMFDNYPESENPLREAAIVLIDEIDMHLHPQWQRSIIHDLSIIFPNIQFIATTHSPLVIQSMDNINLYVLRNGDNGTEIKSYLNTTFQGWSVDEILYELMELGDDIKSTRYQELMRAFDKALDEDNYSKAKEVYAELKSILHPLNAENKILKMQLDQIKHQDND